MSKGTYSTSISLPKYDFANIYYDMKTLNDNVSDMLKKLTNTSSNTDNNEEKLTEISSKLSNYEYRLGKLGIKDTHIEPLSLQTT